MKVANGLPLGDKLSGAAICDAHVHRHGAFSKWPIPILCFAVWLAFVLPTLSRAPKYSWDSAVYVEAAQSILRGEGLLHRNIAGVDTPLWEPMALWPPGYPILIAIFHALGVPAPEAGVLVSLVSALAFVLLQAWICQRLLHWALAWPVALATTCMPSLYQVSTNCLSDAAYMAFSVGSLACLIGWSDSRNKHWSMLAAAGVLAAAAWAIRNVGVALIVAEGAFLLARFTVEKRRVAWYDLGIWLVSVGVLVTPVLVHNLATFGTFSPYVMPPSKHSLLDNLRALYGALASDLTASRLIASLLKNKYALFAFLVVAALALSFRRQSLAGACQHLSSQRHLLLLAGYAVVFCAVVVAARTKCEWGEPIYWRYLIPVYWIFFICSAAWAEMALRMLRMPAPVFQATIATIFLAVAALQARAQWSWLKQPPSQGGSLAASVGEAAGDFLSVSVPPDQIVLACRANLLRLHCNLNARKIPHSPFGSVDYRRAVEWNEVSHAGGKDLLWGVVIDDVPEARKGEYGPWVQQLISNPKEFPELERLAVKGPAQIFRYASPRDLASRIDGASGARMAEPR